MVSRALKSLALARLTVGLAHMPRARAAQIPKRMIRDESGCLYPRVFTLQALADAMLRAEDRQRREAASPAEVTPGAPSAPSNTARRTENVPSMTFGLDAPSPQTVRGAQRVTSHLRDRDSSAPRPMLPPVRQERRDPPPQPGPSRAMTREAGPRLHRPQKPVTVETGIPKVSKRQVTAAGPAELARIKRAIREGKMRLEDRLGCVELEDQFDARTTIEAAGKNTAQPAAAGSAGATLRHASSLYRAERMSVQFVDALFNAAEREEADGLTWQVRSSGTLGTPGVETTSVTFSDATLIGVTWNTRVRELVLRPCREVGGKETIALPVSAQTARAVAESLACYGIDERLAKRVAAEFIVEGQHQCTDLSLPFYAAMASMLALVEAKATPVGGDAVVVPRIGWSAGLPNGVAGRNLAFAGLHENQRADVALLSAFAKEGGYVTEDHELDFIAAFDPIRGAGPFQIRSWLRATEFGGCEPRRWCSRPYRCGWGSVAGGPIFVRSMRQSMPRVNGSPTAPL